MFRKLWDDDCGSGVLTGEWLFLFSILLLGTVSGLVAMRQALVGELAETARSVMSLDQTYSFSGQSNAESVTGGSSASDTTNSVHYGRFMQHPCD